LFTGRYFVLCSVYKWTFYRKPVGIEFANYK